MERASLAGDIRKLEADRKEFDAYQIRTRFEIASEKLFAEAITTQAQTVVLSLSQQEKNLTSEVEVLGAQVMKLSEEEKKLDRSVKYLDLSISELGDEFIATKRNRDDMIVLANKEIKAKQIELMDIEARIQEEIKKIEIPYTTLMLERQNFEKFRMDVRVMYDRANRLWCAMYPGQSLEDILIKQ
jgi:predicted RNase H-like nuclease (RuvC/YqgF family)